MSLIYLIIGLAAGLLSGLFGIGGGVVIVPGLLLFTRMTPATATGTSLGALLFPAGALGAWVYYKHGHVDVRASVLIALGILVGAFFGARVAEGLDPVTARRAFAVFMALMSVKVWLG